MHEIFFIYAQQWKLLVCDKYGSKIIWISYILVSPTKNRTTSAGSAGKATKGSKTPSRVLLEDEAQPVVDDEGATLPEEHYEFVGYDVGDDLIHVTGVQSSMFPSDGGQIRVEKTQYVRGQSYVSTSVHKNGNILKVFRVGHTYSSLVITNLKQVYSFYNKEFSCIARNRMIYR